MYSRAATCGPTSVGMFVLLLPGVWEPLTVTPLSTVWQHLVLSFRDRFQVFETATGQHQATSPRFDSRERYQPLGGSPSFFSACRRSCHVAAFSTRTLPCS